MNKQKDKNSYSLRLAVAAATLGMSMGVSPDVVLANPDTEVGQEPVQVAAADVNYWKFEHQADPTVRARPDAVFPKVEHQGVQYDKHTQPGVQDLKFDQHGAQPPKTEIIDVPSNPGDR